VAQQALDQRLEPAEELAEIAAEAAPERRWPLRRRALVIAFAATGSWLIPGVIVYLLLAAR
jgi:hypothetical protein